jgi:hypothetical protein
MIIEFFLLIAVLKAGIPFFAPELTGESNRSISDRGTRYGLM